MRVAAAAPFHRRHRKVEYRVVCGDRDGIFSQAGGGGLSMGGQDWKGVGGLVGK